eukprot:GHVT01018078.1.p1 GENE.GHVT01018078.1~~GHVT01018078.1.p1  ORF type:complete len:106 (-),score=7.75 GHVT01018078.1:68-385(-)
MKHRQQLGHCRFCLKNSLIYSKKLRRTVGTLLIGIRSVLDWHPRVMNDIQKKFVIGVPPGKGKNDKYKTKRGQGGKTKNEKRKTKNEKRQSTTQSIKVSGKLVTC